MLTVAILGAGILPKVNVFKAFILGMNVPFTPGINDPLKPGVNDALKVDALGTEEDPVLTPVALIVFVALGTDVFSLATLGVL